MKTYNIALAQINPILGNLNYNTKNIIKVIDKISEKSDLIVFPELCLVGYPPEDLILRNNLLTEVKKFINIIKEHARNKKVSIIFGAPIRLDKDIGNAAIYFNGKSTSVIFKNNLPNYGVFDEKRIFKAGPSYNCIKFKGLKI